MTTARSKIRLPDAAPTSPLRGTLVRVLTPQERLADMRAHGRQTNKSKESAVAFLQRAGIADATGALAEPFRD